MSILTIYRSSLGKKVAMALSGFVLFGYVAGHMMGNLKVFLGAEEFNAYAHWLREVGAPALPHYSFLWAVRVFLLLAVVVHVVAAVQLTRMNLEARPVRYQRLSPAVSDYAARTMRWSGVLIFFYVVYHVMHLTLGNVHHDFIPGDAFHNLVTGMQLWPVALVYIVANLLLGLHLYHGLWSFFQTLGLSHPEWDPLRRRFAVGASVIVTVGFLSVPVSILSGIVS